MMDESKIDYNDIFNKENISKKALNILAWLNLNYFSTPEEKSKLIKQYRENDYIAEQDKKEKYDSNNLLKNNSTTKVTSQELQNELTSMIEYKDRNLFQKLFDKIKRIFIKNLIF